MKPDEKLDLTGTGCPQNSAMALLRLESMEHGSILEISIDDGEPIKNVTAVIEEDGHRIICAKKLNNKCVIFVKRL